jgi:NTP pyrophosphatase (non-canonical NTP hydrolase)
MDYGLLLPLGLTSLALLAFAGRVWLEIKERRRVKILGKSLIPRVHSSPVVHAKSQMNPYEIPPGFIQNTEKMCGQVHALAVSKEFWPDGGRNDGELLMLVVSELGEAIEALRTGNKPSEHIPEFSSVEEELADAVIRIGDLCAARGWRLGEAIVAKHRFNQSREKRHGKLW